MSEEEIKKLSKKLAQTLYDDDAYQMCASWTQRLPIDCKAFELEKTLEVLLRDHCIVPKEVVMAIYNRKTIPTKEDVTNKLIEECVISAIFPELFEQKGE